MRVRKTLIELYAAINDLSRNKRKNGTEVSLGLRLNGIGSFSAHERRQMHGVLWLHMRLLLSLLLLFSGAFALAQQPAATGDDYSGMYSFLRDGEFIQISVEDQGNVSGFISRYGDSSADKDAFLDQFLDSGKLDGDHLTFTTKNVHGVRFAFDGTITRGTAKSADEEGYYIIRGTLTRFETDAEKKTTEWAQKVEFKSFPRDQ